MNITILNLCGLTPQAWGSDREQRLRTSAETCLIYMLPAGDFDSPEAALKFAMEKTTYGFYVARDDTLGTYKVYVSPDDELRAAA